ncbi:MAG: hypothetical protein M0R32_08095 [Candidatus Cloacimonetes bacterium]|jgi:hypothetical protein|nr:hypothetical protein [Candidatus Cloacimonadota bacterium]
MIPKEDIGELKFSTDAMRKICIEQSIKMREILFGRDSFQRKILPPKEAKIGDQFMACPKCLFQFDIGTVARPECPECGNRMDIYKVTKDDV